MTFEEFQASRKEDNDILGTVLGDSEVKQSGFTYVNNTYFIIRDPNGLFETYTMDLDFSNADLETVERWLFRRLVESK